VAFAEQDPSLEERTAILENALSLLVWSASVSYISELASSVVNGGYNARGPGVRFIDFEAGEKNLKT
jgi:hypothetical protein